MPSPGISVTARFLLPRLLAGVIEQPAGQQDIPLPGRYRHPDLYLPVAAAERDTFAARGGGYLLVYAVYRYLVAFGEGGVVGLVFEAEGQYAVIYEVCPVYTREAQSDDALDAQIQRGQRRVLAAGALAVVLSRDDEAAAVFLRPRREPGVAGREAEFGQIRHVGAVGQEFRVRRHDVVRRDVVAQLY
jgi:hypothetical protein